MNVLRIIENEKFKKVRMIEIDGQIFFIARDIAENLGYTNYEILYHKKVTLLNNEKCSIYHQ